MLSRHQRRTIEAREMGFCVQCLSRKAIPVSGTATCEKCRERNTARYQSPEVLAAKAYVSELRARTVCERCGARPIEWHRKAHAVRGQDRISNKASRGESRDAIDAEIARCEALCVPCHRAEDSRRDSVTGRFLSKSAGELGA